MVDRTKLTAATRELFEMNFRVKNGRNVVRKLIVLKKI